MERYLTHIRKTFRCVAVGHAVTAGSPAVTVTFKILSEHNVYGNIAKCINRRTVYVVGKPRIAFHF